MPNPNDPDQAECQVCFDQGSPPGSYAPCSNCRPVDYEKYWAKHKGAPTAENDAPEVGECLWANQLCEQPNNHGCKTCLAVEPTRPIPPGVDQ